MPMSNETGNWRVLANWLHLLEETRVGAQMNPTPSSHMLIVPFADCLWICGILSDALYIMHAWYCGFDAAKRGTNILGCTLKAKQVAFLVKLPCNKSSLVLFVWGNVEVHWSMNWSSMTSNHVLSIRLCCWEITQGTRKSYEIPEITPAHLSQSNYFVCVCRGSPSSASQFQFISSG